MISGSTASHPTLCARCSTELPPRALACPACGALLHADRLRELAAQAARATDSGDTAAARRHWSAALDLLPAHSPQHQAIVDRLAALTQRASSTEANNRKGGDGGSWWKRIGASGVAVVALLAGKLKFLLLGLTKISTVVSMFAFFGVYWSLYGWPLALGLVVSIYIHEMGHVAALRRHGIASGAPLFIPGVGAVVMLKQHIADPIVDADIGLAGPLWGLGAAVGALALYGLTGAPTWRAIAELTALINLFNLTPVWQLDGSRGFHALDRLQRWFAVAAIALAYAMTSQGLLVLVGAVAVYRAFKGETGKGDVRTLLTYVGLVLALAWLARGVG